MRSAVVCLLLVAARALAADAPAGPAPAAAPAQGPQALDISLARAVATAMEKSPRLAAVREDLAASLARLDAARAEGRPAASASAFVSRGTMGAILPGPAAVMPRMWSAAPDLPRAEGGLMVMYPLATGGRIAAGVGAAGAAVAATQADVDAMVLEVAYAVRTAYWRALLAADVVKAEQENVVENTERLRLDQAALAAGKVPQYYVLRGTAEAADAEQALARAERDAEIALLDLKAVMGLQGGPPLALTDALKYEPSAAPEDVEAVLREALAHRPEARAAAARVAQARRQVAARRAAFQPQVDAMLMLGGETVSGMGSGGGYTAGLAASLPILDGGMRRADLAEAEAMKRKAEREQVAAAIEIERQVRSAVVSLAAAERSVRAAMEALASAAEDHRVAMMRYQAGRAVNLEPISALAALVRARTNLAQALYEHNLARDAIALSAGRRPPIGVE
jgi:outer membrane protein TolC